MSAQRPNRLSRPKEAIHSKDLHHYFGGTLLADSHHLGWHQWQAQAYRYDAAQTGYWHIPYVQDGYLIEIQTSCQTIEFEQKAAQWIKHRWQRGDMFLYPYGKTTEWRCNNSQDTVAFLIPFSHWRSMALDVLIDQSALGGSDIALISCFPSEDVTLRQLLLMLADELTTGGPNGGQFADGLAIAATTRLLRYHSTLDIPPQKTAKAPVSRRFHRVFKFIEAHLDQPIKLDDLAMAAGVSPSYFPRLFRQTTGQTPYQFLIHQRCKRAAQLLSNRELSIASIALAVGFANQSHFTTAFRKMSGTTPSAYRKGVVAQIV